MRIAERIMETHPDSALNILQHLKQNNYNTSPNRALYGLLLFHALERCDKQMQPDSLIDFSIKYYKSKDDNLHLAGCYFYKGHKFKHAQHYDEAGVLYFKALECLHYKNDFVLSGRIYEDIGDICSFQTDYKESLQNYQTALNYFNLVKYKIDAGYMILSIGRTYRFLKNSKTAQLYYRKALSQVNDSMLAGAIYQDIGINFYENKQLDSARY
jgi:tetratricopeptide (TPR) repeat protein